MKTLDGTLYRRALDCSGPQSAHTRVVPRAGGQSPLWVKPESPEVQPGGLLCPRKQTSSEESTLKPAHLRVHQVNTTVICNRVREAAMRAASLHTLMLSPPVACPVMGTHPNVEMKRQGARSSRTHVWASDRS
jgi:hypothetical protein